MQMEHIEKAIGKKITRIETNDLDEMEEVSACSGQLPVAATHRTVQKMKKALK